MSSIFCLNVSQQSDVTNVAHSDKEDLIQYLQSYTPKKLVGFQIEGRGIPRHDYVIANAEGTPIGRVTSGTMSPSLKQGIGLGYVPINYATPGTEIYIQIRKKQVPATVVKLPFYKQ